MVTTKEVPNSIESDTAENVYFSLDLRIPKISDQQRAKDTDHRQLNSNLPKFGLAERLEDVFQEDLKINNPWLNKDVPFGYFERQSKKVRFATTEIQTNNPQLPNCRKNYPCSRPGQLHAPHCKNAAQETFEVLGDHSYQNRQFILQDLEDRIESRNY